MNCVDFDRMADPLVDGELADSDRAEAEGHLALCPTCQQQVGGLRALKGAVKRSAGRAAPHHLREAVRTRIRQEPVLARIRPSLRNAPAYAAAAAAVVAASWAGVRYQGSQEAGTGSFEPLAAEAVNLHQRNVPQDLSTGDRDRASQWAEPRLGFRTRVPALPLQLTGVSVTHFGNRAAADYHFQDGAGRTVTMVAYDGAGVPEVPGASVDPDFALRPAPVQDVRQARSHGYPVVQWRKDGIVYILTGDLEERDIPQVIQSLGK